MRAFPALIAAFLLTACETAKLTGDSVEAKPTTEPAGLPASSRSPAPPLPLPDDLRLLGLEAGAPLASPTAPTNRFSAVSDAGVPPSPEWLRPDQKLGADSSKERELLGIRLEGEWRFFDVPSASRGPEVNAQGVEAARKSTALKWTIDLAEAGRMRVRFVSKAFPLPHGTELRARVDRYGHLLVWPDASRYRTLSPGTVRTLLNERRADVTPLARPRVEEAGRGARRFGLLTRRTELSTRTGSLTLDRAKLPEAGQGGVLLCRLFAELVAIDPSSADCLPGEVPLRAQLTWPTGGSIAFEVTAMQHRPDIPSSLLLMPPPSAAIHPGELPPRSTEPLLSPKDLAGFRFKPLDRPAAQAPGTPREGLLAYNATDLLRYVLVDGVPVAWLSPWQEQHIRDLPEGRYVVGWRSFFGESVESPEILELPARIATGAMPDAGSLLSPRNPRP